MNEVTSEIKLYSTIVSFLILVEAILYFFYPNSPFEGFIMGMGFSFALILAHKLFFEKEENVSKKSSKGKSKKWYLIVR